MGSSELVMRLIGPPEADGEYVALRADGSGSGSDEDVVHLHDYARLYGVPGLYEHIVQDLLGCRSPQVAAEGFARALERLSLDASRMTVLDLGAGTGLVGALVRAAGVSSVVGLDALPDAREACRRDRPGVYDDYLVGDLAEPGNELLARLRHHHLTGLVSAGAFGGTHAPPAALLNALALLPAGAPVAFTIDERWTASDGPGGFRSAVDGLVDSGRLELFERSRFLHRVTTAGEPVHYELFVGASHRPDGPGWPQGS
jgi:SAM-dependent methyltransferase